jgi:hypothetical protein
MKPGKWFRRGATVTIASVAAVLLFATGAFAATVNLGGHPVGPVVISVGGTEWWESNVQTLTPVFGQSIVFDDVYVSNLIYPGITGTTNPEVQVRVYCTNCTGGATLWPAVGSNDVSTQNSSTRVKIANDVPEGSKVIILVQKITQFGVIRKCNGPNAPKCSETTYYTYTP